MSVVKYSVQLTSRATGTIQLLDVEAASEEEAIGMFDAAKYAVTIIRPDEQQASRERIERLQEETKRVNEAIRKHYVAKAVVMWYLVAIGLAFALVAFLNMHFDRGETDLFPAEKSDVQKAVEFKVLTDD